MKALVCGAGSIGRRHANNLRGLGVEVMTCDPMQEADYKDLEEALQIAKPDMTIVCSPTALHVPQALTAAKAGTHLFIEKPLSFSLEGVDKLKDEVAGSKLSCMVGCNMRFHFGPATLKSIANAGTIGTPVEATVYTGSYLPHWRPQQDYMKSYSADPVQGGAILDCIHEIDLALWFLGPATLTAARKESAASIGILQVEGTADLELAHSAGAKSHVHLSFTEPEYRRFSKIRGTKGTVDWDFTRKSIIVRDLSGTVMETISEPAGYDINQMYIDELKHFLDCIKKQKPNGNIDEAISALEIALKAKRT